MRAITARQNQKSIFGCVKFMNFPLSILMSWSCRDGKKKPRHARTWETKINFSTSANFGWKFLFFSLFARAKNERKLKEEELKNRLRKDFRTMGVIWLLGHAMKSELSWICLRVHNPRPLSPTPLPPPPTPRPDKLSWQDFDLKIST